MPNIKYLFDSFFTLCVTAFNPLPSQMQLTIHACLYFLYLSTFLSVILKENKEYHRILLKLLFAKIFSLTLFNLFLC